MEFKHIIYEKKEGIVGPSRGRKKRASLERKIAWKTELAVRKDEGTCGFPETDK